MKEGDVILFDGEYRSIANVKLEGNIVRIAFNFLAKEKWDTSLTKRSKTHRLSIKRVTGMKGNDE